MQVEYFSGDINRSCLVYMFSLHFSGSKCLINLRLQFRARKFFFLYVKSFFADLQSLHVVFKITISKMRHLCVRFLSFIKNCLLTGFSRSSKIAY